MTNSQSPKSVIGEDVEITGSIKCASDIQIDGKLNGDLVCNGNALIGGKAVIKGNITVEAVTILGQVNGNVSARDRIELKSTTRLNGDIKAKRLTVEDGVTFIGKSEVNPSGTSSNRGAAEPRGEEAGARPAEPAEKEPADDRTKAGFFGKK